MKTEELTCDVAIVGAGPSGSSLAIRLREAGLDVVLLEKDRFPRHKLCGEFISPECLPHLSELGVDEQIALIGPSEIVATDLYTRSGRRVIVDSSWFTDVSANASGLSRAMLDDVLLDRARAVGATVLTETALTSLCEASGRVAAVNARDALGNRVHISSRLTIDSTGRARAAARKLSNAPKSVKPTHIAFKTHLQNALLPPGRCEIYSFEAGYGGCNAIEGGLFNLCFIVDLKKLAGGSRDGASLMRTALCTNQRADLVLKDASSVTPWLAVPIARFGTADIAPAPGLLAVGDAGSFIDPFTGSGILMALESSAIASAVIIDSLAGEWSDRQTAEDYRSRYNRKFASRLRAASLFRAASFSPRLADVLVWAFSQSAWLSRRAALATRSSGRLDV